MTITTVRGFDATHADIASLPAGQAAGYITGSSEVEWTGEDWAAHIRAVRIDQSPANTSFDETADVLDYEGSAATISDVAPWAKAALANYNSAARPGQRSPAIYMSAVNVTAVVNALTAGKVTGIGLWIADWTNNQAAATAEVASGNGPYPVIAVQYQNAGLYDEDIFSVPWLTSVSTAAPAPVVQAQVPPGQWSDPAAWTWAEVTVTGTGLDGKLHSFVLSVNAGTWVKIA